MWTRKSEWLIIKSSSKGSIDMCDCITTCVRRAHRRQAEHVALKGGPCPKSSSEGHRHRGVRLDAIVRAMQLDTA